jgi:hypothetical protein
MNFLKNLYGVFSDPTTVLLSLDKRSMTQQISEKRQKNFLKLLDQGVGIVALHHTMGSFQQLPV